MSAVPAECSAAASVRGCRQAGSPGLAWGRDAGKVNSVDPSEFHSSELVLNRLSRTGQSLSLFSGMTEERVSE